MLQDLQTLLLTTLFNPALLLFFVLTFFLGKFIGRLSARPNVWKVIVLLYLGVFLFEPIRNSGPIIGGIFLLGFLSGHAGLLWRVFGWAESVGDVIYAMRHRRAFEDIRRREQELHERERRFREEENRFRQEQQRESSARQRDSAAGTRRNPDKKSASSSKGHSSRSTSGKNRSSTEKRRSTKKSSPMNERNGHLVTLGLKADGSYTREQYKRAYRRKALTSRSKNCARH